MLMRLQRVLLQCMLLPAIGMALPEVRSLAATSNVGKAMLMDDSEVPRVVRNMSSVLRWACFGLWTEAWMGEQMPRLNVHVSRNSTTRLHSKAHPLGKQRGITYHRPFAETRVPAELFFARGAATVTVPAAAAAAAPNDRVSDRASYTSPHLAYFAPLANTTAAIRASVGSAHALVDGTRPILEMNLWMAMPGMTTPLHYDGSHNAYVQVRGTKRFVLLPPAAWRTLGLYPRVHPSSRQVPAAVWLNATSREATSGAGANPAPASALPSHNEDQLRALGAMQVTLTAGDMLYIPPFWFHRVEAVDVGRDGVQENTSDAAVTDESVAQAAEAQVASMSVSVHSGSVAMDIVAGARKFGLPTFGGLDHSQRVEITAQYVDGVVRDLARLNAVGAGVATNAEVDVPAAAEVAADAGAGAGAGVDAVQHAFLRNLLVQRFGHLRFDSDVEGLAGALSSTQARFGAITERVERLPQEHPLSKLVHKRVASFVQWCHAQIMIDQAAWEIVLGDHVEDVIASALGPLSVAPFLQYMTGELTLARGGAGGGADVGDETQIGAGVKLVELHPASREMPLRGVSAGDRVSIHYTAWLAGARGQQLTDEPFDSSRGGEAFHFRAGALQVIAGMDRAVRSLRLGERGLFFIPSAQGYGSLGAGDADDVPPFADLLFDIELLAVTAGQ